MAFLDPFSKDRLPRTAWHPHSSPEIKDRSTPSHPIPLACSIPWDRHVFFFEFFPIYFLIHSISVGFGWIGKEVVQGGTRRIPRDVPFLLHVGCDSTTSEVGERTEIVGGRRSGWRTGSYSILRVPLSSVLFLGVREPSVPSSTIVREPSRMETISLPPGKVPRETGWT